MNTIEGTVSHGTMRDEDLIPAFIDCALAIVGKRPNEPTNQIQTRDQMHMGLADVRTRSSVDGYFADENSDARVNDLEYLFDTLDYLAPEGHYFGSHPGDGSDFGFWKASDDE